MPKLNLIFFFVRVDCREMEFEELIYLYRGMEFDYCQTVQMLNVCVVELDVLGEVCGADITERLLLPTVLAMAGDSVANVR